MNKSIFKGFGAFFVGLLIATVPARGEIVDPDNNVLPDSADIGDIDQSKTKIIDLKERIAPNFGVVSNAAMSAATDADLAEAIAPLADTNWVITTVSTAIAGADMKPTRIYNARGTNGLDDKGQLFDGAIETGGHWEVDYWENGIHKIVTPRFDSNGSTAYWSVNPSSSRQVISYNKVTGEIKFYLGDTLTLSPTAPTGKDPANTAQSAELAGVYTYGKPGNWYYITATYVPQQMQLKGTPYGHFALESIPEREYSSSEQYAVGDLVKYRATANDPYKAYRCNTAIPTAENWTAAHWTEIPVLDQMVGTNEFVGVTNDLALVIAQKASQSDISSATNAVLNSAKVYSDGKTFVISTEDEYYRTGASGELGIGWAYYAISGDGHRRFAAYAPKVSGSIMLIPLNDGDPICETFGTNFSMSASSRTVTSILDYTETGFRGYNSVTISFAPIADIPLTVVVSKNATTGTASINSVNLPYSFYDTVHEQYYYDVSVDGTDITYSYELYDTAQGAWTTGYGSFRVAIDETGGDDIEMTVFGDKGAYMLAAEVDTARSQLVQRTGKRGELGTGPGYKIYDFTSDVRAWELTVPRLDANRGYSTLRCGEERAPVAPGSAGRLQIEYSGITIFNSDDYPGIAGIGYYIFPSVYADPLSLIQTDQVVERVVWTEGTLSSKCKSAIREIAYFPIDLNRKEWGPGVFNLSSSNECGTAYGWGSLSLDTNRLEVIRNSFNQVIAYRLPGFTLCFTNIAPPLASTAWASFASNPYYAIYTHSGDTSPITNVYTLSNFKLLSVDTYGNFSPTVNNQTISFNITYDVVCHGGAWYMTSSPSSSQSGRTFYYSDTLARFDNQVYTYTVPRTLSLVAYSSTWETLTTQGDRLITDQNQHLFWDEAMKVTWEISVTNGCFFSEIIGDKDYRKEDY